MSDADREANRRDSTTVSNLGDALAEYATIQGAKRGSRPRTSSRARAVEADPDRECTSPVVSEPIAPQEVAADPGIAFMAPLPDMNEDILPRTMEDVEWLDRSKRARDRLQGNRAKAAAPLYNGPLHVSAGSVSPLLSKDEERRLEQIAWVSDVRRRLWWVRGQLLECDQTHKNSERRFWKVHDYAEKLLLVAFGERAKENFRHVRDEDHKHPRPLNYSSDHALDFMCHAHARFIEELRSELRPDDIRPGFHFYSHVYPEFD